MAKILFLDPLGYDEKFLRHRHLLREWSGTYITGDIPFPPLDLMYAASYLRKYGHSVGIIEASVNHWSHNKVAGMVAAEAPDFVVIPTTYYSLDSDRLLAGYIKKELPSVKIVFSGAPVIYEPRLALDSGVVDFVVLGEMELPVLNIVEANYAENIAYRDGEKIIKGCRSLLNLDELELPARDLIDSQAYRYVFFNRANPVTTMSLSRGCPHGKCNFCVSSFYSLSQIRFRRLDSVIKEIEEIVYRYKIGEIFFRDQALTANRELVWTLCEELISKNIRIPWRGSTRVDLVDKELLSLMRRAGCYQLSFGFESPSQKVLDLANKGIKVEQSRKASHWAKEAGLEVVGLFICGLPGGGAGDSVNDLLKFALELEVDYAQFCGVYLFPGTPYYEQFSQNVLSPPSLDSVKKDTRRAFLKFYLRSGFINGQLKKIHSLEDFKFLITSGVNAFLSYM
ncbi:MAG: radical SAM protein [Candidatus Omnitrophica bacterium]|jgi:radical SAM superfamily enzyme YgiQ (UPF0313 family)|nr:radical SAM protein [Candidatus Omnitrophota bacterium]